MLPTAGNTPRDVLAVLRAHAARAGGENQLLAMGAQPLSGGRNNAAYRCCADLSEQFDRARRHRSAAAAIRADRAASCP
jgi:hypothetical protein